MTLFMLGIFASIVPSVMFVGWQVWRTTSIDHSIVQLDH